MDFTSAFISMQQGHKVTRTTWKGYWCILNGEIVMVTKEGKAINLRESPDMMYTISNMLCDDWGVCDDRVVSMLPGESATVASNVDQKNLRNDAKVNKHEEQKKQPINNPISTNPRCNVNYDKSKGYYEIELNEIPGKEYPRTYLDVSDKGSMDSSKNETKSTSSAKTSKNKHYDAVVIDDNGEFHKITLDNIPGLKQFAKDDNTLERLINWLL